MWDPEPAEPSAGVIYKPCKFCGSLDYDIADGDVDKNNVYEPDTCDVCAYGDPLTSKYIHIH